MIPVENLDSREFEQPISDEDLTALALAADPSEPLPEDAVPWTVVLAQSLPALPGWYMPPAMSRADKPWRRPVVLTIVVALLIIEAFGLCNTYGSLGLG
jgi:hypothetical protein